MKYTITQSRLLYVLSINDRKHQNLLKVGEVFVDNDVADNPSKQVLGQAVRNILDKRHYMKNVTYNIEYVECTTYNQHTKCYEADDIYRTLTRNGVLSQTLNKLNKEDVDIWFHASLLDITTAIDDVKSDNGAGYGAIKFRPEQDAAIKATVEHFKKPKGKAFLWNAKMRFGKTLSGLQVAKEMGYKSTLIITHRPVVDKGWHEDFEKIFGSMPEYSYATRMSDDDATGDDFGSLTRKVDAGKKKIIFFVSMQYLRLSKFVGGKERNEDPLKKAIMEYNWDFVMVDEAHEGIEAAAGVRVMAKLKKENTRILSLSGTPFNLLDKYEEGEIYTWDYVMEQQEKHKWDDLHYGDPNPYANLPQMQILTFTLPKMVRDEAIENNEVFKFHEFFRVWTEADKDSILNLIDKETNPLKKAELQAKLKDIKIDKFIHEGAIRKFVAKLREKSDSSQYPFSTQEFRDKFRHTFWLLPGVKEAAALEEILRQDKVFGEGGKLGFRIINAAGDGNIEDKDGSALNDVQQAIRTYKRTITLSCGKLTTGVSVPEWTAVLCMKGSENTPAANYMQTIFRVQTHAVLNGRQKSDCYVFDFAPDRALTAVAETAKMAVYAQTEKGKKQMKLTQKKEEEHLEAFIKLCPVLSMDEGEMGKHFSANQIFEKLSNVYIERAVRSGYADNSLYNPEQLMNLNPEQEKALGNISDLLGGMPNIWKPEKIHINGNGIGDTKNAEQVKYIYYNTANKNTPAKPQMSAETDDNGCPMTDTEGWDEVMCAPTQLFPYLFVSNTRLIDGTWTSFSQPVLWKEWHDKDKDTDEAKKKREEENKEKRARMSVLRGVAIRIPLLVYGAEINDDEGEEITIDNFASEEIVDQASWDEFMPKGFTKETFNLLKDCFDRSIFTGAAKRIRQMVKEADNLSTEDRIAKIATIFSYFHNPDKETVLTPWRVVNMHMSDCLGGWCFFNEEFDANYTIENQYGENINAARPVGIKVKEDGNIEFLNKTTKEVFGNYNARILEINSKTGLYPLYMAYSVFKSVKEPEWRKIKLTGERGKNRDAEQYYHQAGNDLEIWKDVLQDNIFVVCRTKMAVSITKRTLAGFRKDIRMNIKCYDHKVTVNDLISVGIINANNTEIEKVNNTYYFADCEEIDCDMINVLRAKPEYFQNDIVRGKDFWHVYNSIPLSKDEDINNMKFTAIVGNPPYQINVQGRSEQPPIYHLFYKVAYKLSDIVSLISPARFLFNNGKTPKEWNLEMLDNKDFKVVRYYKKSNEVFGNVDIKGGVATTLYYKGANYGPIKEFIPLGEVQGILELVDRTNNLSLNNFITSCTAYKYSDKFKIEHPELIERVSGGSKQYAHSKAPQVMPEVFLSDEPNDGHKYARILAKIENDRKYVYFREDYLKTPQNYNKYKVVVASTNGSGAFGEKLSSPFVGRPGEGSTETFMSLGCFNTQREAENLLKYLKTKFARTLLSSKKATQGNKTAETWANIPMQNFSILSDIDWNVSISEIDKQLYLKYNIDDADQQFIEDKVLPMD